jgi:hypothetical protein
MDYTGTAIGTALAPGVGTAAGLSFDLGKYGSSKQKKAAKKARAKYEAALRDYQNLSEANLAGRRAHLVSQGNLAQQNFQNYLGGMPSDQTATLANDQANQMAALQTTQPALSGPLAAQYGAEFAGRTNVALQPMAHSYAAGQQGQAVIANDRGYDLQGAMLRPTDANFNQRYNLTQSALDANRQQAEAAFGVDSAKAQNAGAEQMMYGGMISSVLGVGGQVGYGMAQNQRSDRQASQQPRSTLQPDYGVGSNSYLFQNP